MSLVSRSALAVVAIVCSACGGPSDQRDAGSNTGANTSNTVCQPNASTDCASLPPAQVGGKTFVDNNKSAICAADGKSWDTSKCVTKTSPSKNKCTPNSVVDCGDVPPADVGGEEYVAGLDDATCSADGTAWDVTKCTSRGGGEFALCQNQSDCGHAFTCVTTASFVSFCLATCSDSSDCADDSACIDWSGDELKKYCLPLSDTGNMCFADDSCANADDACIATAYDAGDFLYSTCTRECASTNIGKQAGCHTGEYCVANNVYIKLQQGAPACTLTQANPCSAAQGFRCIELEDGPKCARELGMCVGDILPIFSTVSALATMTDADYCTLPLEPEGKSNASIGEVFFANTACGLRGVTGLPAEVTCERLDVELGFCAAFCGLENGTQLSCGTGYTCQAPPLSDAIFIDYQMNGTAKTTCTGPTDTAHCDASHTCFNTAASGAPTYFCVSASKVCVPN